jgi:hypothetical protein
MEPVNKNVLTVMALERSNTMVRIAPVPTVMGLEKRPVFIAMARVKSFLTTFFKKVEQNSLCSSRSQW